MVIVAASPSSSQHHSPHGDGDDLAAPPHLAPRNWMLFSIIKTKSVPDRSRVTTKILMGDNIMLGDILSDLHCLGNDIWPGKVEGKHRRMGVSAVLGVARRCLCLPQPYLPYSFVPGFSVFVVSVTAHDSWHSYLNN